MRPLVAASDSAPHSGALREVAMVGKAQKAVVDTLVGYGLTVKVLRFCR